MLAQYKDLEPDEARQEIIEHTESEEDLDRLNDRQRIILVSHRFAPQVTSAALWLNEQAHRDLVTCVQLTPYKDSASGELYILANTIIPIPGAEHYFIGLSNRTESGTAQQGPNPNKDDEITQFCRKIQSRVTENLPTDLAPNKGSRWAGKYQYSTTRYYHLWYAEPLWGNWKMSFQIELTPPNGNEGETVWNAWIGLGYNKSIDEQLRTQLRELSGIDEMEIGDTHIGCRRKGESLDESFCDTLAQLLRRFVEAVTPMVREFAGQLEEEDA